MRPNVALLGFMGTGKTSVGRELARLLGREFIDVDQFLEAKLGLTIEEIFAREGEAAFRRFEREAIGALAEREGLVLATGGGAVLERENVAALRRRGFLVLLTARPETILRRLKGDEKRPLLGRGASLDSITELLRARDTLYRAAADAIVATDGASTREVAERIREMLPGGPSGGPRRPE